MMKAIVIPVLLASMLLGCASGKAKVCCEGEVRQLNLDKRSPSVPVPKTIQPATVDVNAQ
jgi:hypothetical protein